MKLSARQTASKRDCQCQHHVGKDRKSTRLNSSHGYISYAVFCLKKKNRHRRRNGNGDSDNVEVDVSFSSCPIGIPLLTRTRSRPNRYGNTVLFAVAGTFLTTLSV